MKTILNKNQKITRRRTLGKETVAVKISHNDSCGNGHNTFHITADLMVGHKLESGGCIHTEVVKFFPELAQYIKWHGCSTDGPLYYLENTMYHAKYIPKDNGKRYFYLENSLIKVVGRAEMTQMVDKYGDNAVFKPYDDPMAKKPNLEYARSSAIWPEATLEDLVSKERLLARLPALMVEFQEAVESLGLIY